MRPEVSRRVVHATGTLVPVAYLLEVLTWQQVRYVLIGGILLTLTVETVRLIGGLDLPLVRRMIRHYEEEYLAGYALYVFGGGLTGLIFEPTIAVPAILMLTIGDPISGLLSNEELRSVKQPHILVIMFTVCLALAWWFVPPEAAVVAALVATLADGVKPIVAGYVIDDNLTIPIGAGMAAYLVVEYVPPIT